MLKKDVRILWAAALRAGGYKQGKGELRSVDGRFCCLGVLCDIYTARTGNGQWVTEDGFTDFQVNGELASAFPPKEVLEWSGITMTNVSDLMMRNDGLEGMPRHSFKQLADYIEFQM